MQEKQVLLYIIQLLSTVFSIDFNNLLFVDYYLSFSEGSS